MKIGIFTPYLDSLTGGEKYMLSLASLLAKNHIVDIFWDIAKEKEIKEKALTKLGIDISKVQFQANIFNRKTSLLRRLMKTKEYDLIIVLSDGSIPVVACKLFLHFQFPVEWVNGFSVFNRIKIARVEKIICNSQFTKSFIDKKFSVDSVIVYPPISFPQKNIEKKENIILTVGRFGVVEGVNFKKHDVLIQIFTEMVKIGLKSWKFILAVSVRESDKNLFKHLQKKAEKLPIHFIENPSHSDLWKLYNQAKIYWHASGYGEDLQKYPEKAEHFGISTVEAMSTGAVPVVINAGGQKEIVDHKENGLLWNTIDECIEYTRQLIADETLWNKMSEGAVRKANIFGGNRFEKEIGILLS